MNPLAEASSLVTTSADPNIGSVGAVERYDERRITYINGMKTSSESCALTAMKISATHGFNRVHFVYDPTEGFLWDLYDSCKMLCWGSEKASVQKLTTLWRNLFQEMGENNPESKIVHYTHSRGGLVTALALKNLTDEERKKMIIYNYGSPAVIDTNEVSHSKNIINASDPIPYANIRRWWQVLFSDFAENDEIIPSKNEVYEHGILNEAYYNDLTQNGAQFLQAKA